MIRKPWNEMREHLLDPLTTEEEKLALIPQVAKREGIEMERVADLLIDIALSDASTIPVMMLAQDILAMRVTTHVSALLASESSRRETGVHNEETTYGQITKCLLGFYSESPFRTVVQDEKRHIVVTKFAETLLELDLLGELRIGYAGDVVIRMAAYAGCHKAIRKYCVIPAVPALCELLLVSGVIPGAKRPLPVPLAADWSLMPIPILGPDAAAERQAKNSEPAFQLDIHAIENVISRFSHSTEHDSVIVTLVHLLGKAREHLGVVAAA